jgi:hypothetical protein
MQYWARKGSVDGCGPGPSSREVDGQRVDHQVEVIPAQHSRWIKFGSLEDSAETGDDASERNTLHKPPPADFAYRVVFAAHSNRHWEHAGFQEESAEACPVTSKASVETSRPADTLTAQRHHLPALYRGRFSFPLRPYLAPGSRVPSY